MKGARAHLNQRSLAFIVLIAGIVGGLLIVFSILLLCKYCLNRKNLREAEQMKLLYKALNESSLLDSNRLYHYGFPNISALEPRRSNPLDRYQLNENHYQARGSQQITADYHSSGGQSYHDSRDHAGSKQHDSQIYLDGSKDDEQSYLQVDPRCYVRQNSNASLIPYRKSDLPRLEKGHSLNVDTRPSPSSTSLSPYRQSSFDVTLAYRSPQQQQQQLTSTPSASSSTQQEIYYTPRGSSLSVMGNPTSNTSTGSQHLSPPTPSTSRKNSAAIILERKDLTATIDPFNQTSTVRASVVPREHEHSRSLEQSTPPNQQTSTANDKQSRSFDAVHLLRPVPNRADVVSRRTKSYEYADDRRPSTVSIAPAPIVIKIPDMSELVQAAQYSRMQDRLDDKEMEEYQKNASRKATLVQQHSVNDYNNKHDPSIASQDLWRLRRSLEIEEQQRLERDSPEDFSPDLLTSTSIDSAGAMPIHNSHSHNTTTSGGGGDDDPSKYQARRKSSSNLLVPPPEVRRQALRRTFEKRRSCINQSNSRREQQALNKDTSLNDENHRSPITDFSSLLNNFNSKSENSSFERSLETDFDMQSDTSSRGPNDQFTSIESSGNENSAPDGNNRAFINRRTQQSPQVQLQQQQLLQLQQQQQQQQQSPQISPHQDDSGYKSLESQNSQNQTFSLGWMSADGAESVIFVGDGRLQQRSVDVKDLEDDLDDKQSNDQRRIPKLLHIGLHHSYQEASTNLQLPGASNSNMMQHRSLSTNIPLVDHDIPSPINLPVIKRTTPTLPMNTKLVTSSSFTRTASKKRREFSKDKRNISANVEPSRQTALFDGHLPVVHQINETKLKPTSSSTSTLQVRHSDLRRTKSDDSRNFSSKNPDNPTIQNSSANRNADNSKNRLSSSANEIVNLTPLLPPPRQHLSPNIEQSRHVVLQRSPSSATPSVTPAPQTADFRSQRSSLSFDHQTPLIPSSTSTKTKSNTNSSFLPTIITKPRFKFSMVRDSAMATLGHSAPAYSMPITRDYSIDEKTNRIVNEFLMHDPLLDQNKQILDDSSHRATQRRHHHRIRPKTFDETTVINNTPKQSSQQTQQSKSIGNKQRHYNTLHNNMRKHSQHQYPSAYFPDSIEQEEDSSDPATPSIVLNQSALAAAARREASMTIESPSIIITGDDSGS